MATALGSLDSTLKLFMNLRSQRDQVDAHKDLMEYRNRTVQLGEADLQFRRNKARKDAEINSEANRISLINATANQSTSRVRERAQDAAEKVAEKNNQEESAERKIKRLNQFSFNGRPLLNKDDPNQGVSINTDVLMDAWQANESWAKELVLEDLRENLILDESVAGRDFSIGRIEPTRKVGELIAGMVDSEYGPTRPPIELGGNVRGAITSDLASAVQPGKTGEQLYTAIGAYGDDGSEAPLTVDGSPGDNAELAELTLSQMANLVARNFTRSVLDTNVGSDIMHELGLRNDMLSAQDLEKQTDLATLEGEIGTAVDGIAQASNTPGFQRGIEALFLDLEPGSQEYRDTLLRVATDLEPYGVEIPESLRADAPDTIYGDRGESMGLPYDPAPEEGTGFDEFFPHRGYPGFEPTREKWVTRAAKGKRSLTQTNFDNALISARDTLTRQDRKLEKLYTSLEGANPRQAARIQANISKATEERFEHVNATNQKLLAEHQSELSKAEKTLELVPDDKKATWQKNVDDRQAEVTELIKGGVRTPAMETKAYKELESKIFSQEELESNLTEVNPEFAMEVLARTEKLVASGALSISDQDEAAALAVVKELRVEPNLDDLVSKAPNKEVLLSMVISAATEGDQTIRRDKFEAMQNYFETGKVSMSGKDLADATTARITEARQGTNAITGLLNAVTASRTEARQLMKARTDLSTAAQTKYEGEVDLAIQVTQRLLGEGSVDAKTGNFVINPDEGLALRAKIDQMSYGKANKALAQIVTTLQKESQKYLNPRNADGIQTARNPQALQILDEATNTFLSLYVQKMVAGNSWFPAFIDYQLNDPHLRHIRYNAGSDEFIFSGAEGKEGSAVPREDIAQANSYIADMLMIKVRLRETLRQGTDE